MRRNPNKKYSCNDAPTKKRENTPEKNVSSGLKRLFSPPTRSNQPRRSVNLDPGKLLEELNNAKKKYLSSNVFNKEYPNYPECITSKKSSSIIKAYAMNSYRGIDRNYNEDRIVANVNVPKPPDFKDKVWPKVSFFAIFDGHAGENCADFLRKNLLNYIITNKNFPINPKEALKGAFEKAEQEFKNLSVINSDGEQKIVDDSGSCAVVALFVENQCYIANVGDSRAVISTDNGKRVKQITKDHKPNDPDERKRVEKNGGKVIKDEGYPEKINFNNDSNKEMEITDDNNSSSEEEMIEIYRVVPGNLAVSRSIGDFSCKLPETGGNPNVLIPIPDIFLVDLTNLTDFVLLGCDGIYDVFSNEDVVEAAWYAEHFSRNCQSDLGLKCANFVNNVIKCAMEEESTDNLSCIIIALNNFEKIAKNKALKEKVHNSIKAHETKK